MAFSVSRSEIGSNRRTVTLMAMPSLVKAETYAGARCRVSVSLSIATPHRWDFASDRGSRRVVGICGAVYQKSYIYLAIARRLTLYFGDA